MKIKLHVNKYEIIHRAIDDGTKTGVVRAFKYTDSPSDETVISAVVDAIMLLLCEVIDFDQ